MKGLLLKDFYMTIKYCRAYLLIMAAFIACSFFSDSNFFLVVYPFVISGMIPVALLGYDERSKWNEYCAALPYSKGQIVSAKYLIGLVLQVGLLVLSGISRAVRMNATGTFTWDGYLSLMALMLIVSCVSGAMVLPFMFKFGVEKGRIAYYVMIGLVCGGSALVSVSFADRLSHTLPGGKLLLYILSAGSAVLYGLSWYASVVFYQKRENI